jgi:hypothetical protein
MSSGHLHTCIHALGSWQGSQTDVRPRVGPGMNPGHFQPRTVEAGDMIDQVFDGTPNLDNSQAPSASLQC